MKYIGLITLLIVIASPSLATDTGRETGLPTPRFVSLKSGEINMRRGPGTRYPIEWVYRRKHLPVEVLEEFGHWRRVRDATGASGWLHKQMLSGSRHAVITSKESTHLRMDPESDAKPSVSVESGVVLLITECKKEWCLLEIGAHEGWLQKKQFYGAYDKELYNP